MAVTSSSTPERGHLKGLDRGDWLDVGLVLAASGFVVAAGIVGQQQVGEGVTIHADAPPLQGHWSIHASASSLLAVAVALWVALAARRWTDRWSWTRLLAASYAGSLAWIVSLTLVDGWRAGFAGRLDNPYDYLTALPRTSDLGEFFATFTDSIPLSADDFWATHVASHPPGAVVPFWLLDRVGLTGSAWAAGLCVLVGASVAVAVLVAVRALADETTARRIAPFLVLSPAALWIGVSADALFAGVSAWGIALLSLGCRRPASRSTDALCVAGGLLLGLGLFMSYGLVLTLAIGASVLIAFGSLRSGLALALGLAVSAGGFTASGFRWWEGYRLVVERYYEAWGGERPYSYWVWANLAVFVVVLGPAALVGIRRLAATWGAGVRTGWANRPTPAITVLVVSSLFAIGYATLAGLSKGEVERIWLPFGVWTAVACASIPPRRVHAWLAAQAVVVLLLQHVLRSPW